MRSATSTKSTCQPACEVSVFEETLVRVVRLAAVVLSPPGRPTVRFSHWFFFGFVPLGLLWIPSFGAKKLPVINFFHFVYLSYRTHMQHLFSRLSLCRVSRIAFLHIHSRICEISTQCYRSPSPHILRELRARISAFGSAWGIIL